MLFTINFDIVIFSKSLLNGVRGIPRVDADSTRPRSRELRREGVDERSHDGVRLHALVPEAAQLAGHDRPCDIAKIWQQQGIVLADFCKF